MNHLWNLDHGRERTWSSFPAGGPRVQNWTLPRHLMTGCYTLLSSAVSLVLKPTNKRYYLDPFLIGQIHKYGTRKFFQVLVQFFPLVRKWLIILS